MPISTISFKRPITSYKKVHKLLSTIMRGHSLFINKKNISNKILLNVGCGENPLKEFVNLDYAWYPDIDICWDITRKKYPFADAKFEGIFTEHCFEHLTFEKVSENLKEFHRLLKPGGTVRIVVPDGQIYFDLYQKKKIDSSVVLPYGENEATPMISINRIFRDHGHLFIYDFETFALMLGEVGFKEIKKCSFREGRDKRLLIDKQERAVESLYVEASK